MEKNLIYRRDLKEYIANLAIQMLMQNNVISEKDLKSIQVDFGYIFENEDGKHEALFKLKCYESVFYFEVSNERFRNIKVNEELYQEAILLAKKHHVCLNDTYVSETDTEKKRRQTNNNILKQKGIVFNEDLRCLSENRKVKDIDSVCKRAIISLLVIQVACDINQGNDVKKSLSIINPLIDKFGVRDAINSKEKRILNGTYSNQDCYDMDWEYEAYWALCWVLGLVNDISDGSICCDCDKAINFVRSCNSFNDFKSSCKLREMNEILDMEDLYFRYNWAINEKRIHSNADISNLNSDIVIERRRGLTWVLSDINDWYDLPLNA